MQNTQNTQNAENQTFVLDLKEFTMWEIEQKTIKGSFTFRELEDMNLTLLNSVLTHTKRLLRGTIELIEELDKNGDFRTNETKEDADILAKDRRNFQGMLILIDCVKEERFNK